MLKNGACDVSRDLYSLIMFIIITEHKNKSEP